MSPEIEKNTAKWNSLNSKHFQNRLGVIIIMIRGVSGGWRIRQWPVRYDYTPKGRALTHRRAYFKLIKLQFLCIHGKYQCANLYGPSLTPNVSKKRNCVHFGFSNYTNVLKCLDTAE